MTTPPPQNHSSASPDPAHPLFERAIVEWDARNNVYVIYADNGGLGRTLKTNLEYWITQEGRRVLGTAEGPARIYREEAAAHLKRMLGRYADV